MKKYIQLSAIILLVFSFNTSSLGQSYIHYFADEGSHPREHAVDMQHMKVEVRFEPQKKLVKGVVNHEFQVIRNQIDTLFFDGPKIKIIEAKLDGQVLAFKYFDKGVGVYFEPALKWGEKHKIEFTYEATPRKGIYFIGWNTPKITDPINQTRKQIWTQGQGIDNRYWIPMYDNMNDKFTTETIVHFPKAYKVLSNGKLLSAKKQQDNIRWHYRMEQPHSGYLLMLGIGDFEIKKSKTKTGIPVQFWYYPQHPERLKWSSMYTENMIEFLENETGIPYPWGGDGYSQIMVQDFIYGAMENTTATIFGDFFWVDERSFNDRNYIGVNAHELTHQWFGDLITARTAADNWLHESWATYYAKLFKASVYGDDLLKWEQRNEQISAINASKKNLYPIRHTQAGTARWYPKGSHVIQMLRHIVGDQDFKRVIKWYLTEHQFANVETNDFYQAFQDVLGLNLDWFFNQWIWHGGEPKYKVKYENFGQKIWVSVDQIHQRDDNVGLFKMPIQIQVNFKDGSQSNKNVWVENKHHDIFFENVEEKEVSYVLFDVNSEILKQVQFEKPYPELAAQFQHAKHMIDRYDALLALQTESIEKKRELLQIALNKETFEEILSEIVRQLASDHKSQETLIEWLYSASVQVQRAYLSSAKINQYNKAFFVSALEHKSYNNMLIALTKLAASFPTEVKLFTEKVDEIRGSAQMIHLKKLELLENWEQIVPFTSNLYEFRTRISAIKTLKRNGFVNSEFIDNLLDAVVSTNRRLASPAKICLQYLAQQNTLKQQIQKQIILNSFNEEELILLDAFR